MQELSDAGSARFEILCELRDTSLIISVGLEKSQVMRFRTSSLIGFVLLAAGTIEFSAHLSNAHASGFQSDNDPKIISARVKGKNLIVIGENFAEGAMILVNGEPQVTRNDSDNPSTRLIAKRTGNAIPNNTFVTIQIQSAGSLTNRFPFFKGRVVTLDDVGMPIRLKVGDRFLLSLGNAAYQFTPAVLDPSILKKVPDVDIPGSQGVFEALRSGSTKLSVVGELPCHKSIPPCLAPTWLIEFSVIVE